MGCSLHESLDEIVITDHRLILQRKLLHKTDSLYERNELKLSLRGNCGVPASLFACCSHTHTHTFTHTHRPAHTKSHYNSYLQDVSCLITASDVCKDTHTPPLACQNLSVSMPACEPCKCDREKRRRTQIKRKKNRERKK